MNSTPEDCIFCQIVAGAMPCIKLFEDGDTLAFMDINPVNDGHCLVMPKAHYPTVFEVPEASFAAAGRTAIRIAKAVNAALEPDGLNLLQANGPGAAQSVGHFKFHILPRRHSDGLKVNWTSKPGDPLRIEAAAKRIRAAL